jgi:site-specific recombinase XerD
MPDRNPAAVYLASLSAGSRRTMRQALSVVANLVSPEATLETLPWASLRFHHVAAIRAKLAERYSAPTANKTLAAVKGTLRAAFALGQMDADTLTKSALVKSVRGENVVQGRAVSEQELRMMFGACNTRTAAGARDVALLAITYCAGLRRHEVVGLDLADFDRHSGVLIVRGKGAKQRKAFINSSARSALDTWLAIRGDGAGPLFRPVNKADRIEARRMSDQAIYMVMRRLATRAHVDRFSPHDLRRSFVGDLLDAGVDIVTVQSLAGHASVSTTSKYDRRGEETRRRATEMLHVPFAG